MTKIGSLVKDLRRRISGEEIVLWKSVFSRSSYALKESGNQFSLFKPSATNSRTKAEIVVFFFLFRFLRRPKD